MYADYGYFLYGGSVSQLLSEFTKTSLGVLRPNFIAVCQPDWALVRNWLAT